MPQSFTHAGQPTPININFWGQFPPHYYQLPQPPHPTQYTYGEGHQPQHHQTLNVPQHLGQQDQHLPLVQDYPSLYTPSPLYPQSYSHCSSLSDSGFSSQQSVPVSTSSVDPASACFGYTAKRSAASSDSDSGVPAYKKPRQQTIPGSPHQKLNISQHNIGQQNQHLPLGQNYHWMDSSPIPSPLAFWAHCQSSLPASGTSSNSGQQPMVVLAGSVPRPRRIAVDSDSPSGDPAHKRPRQSSLGLLQSCSLPNRSVPRSSPQSPYIQPSSTPSFPATRATDTMVDTFISYMRLKYSAKVVETDRKWPFSPTVEYINLTCIDRRCIKSREYENAIKAMVQCGDVDAIQEKKGPIPFDRITQGISLPTSTTESAPDSQPVDDRRLILVEGAPGVGKSTFAWEFCRRWVKGKVAQQYNLVLLLRLRDEGIRSATSLQDLISHPLPGVSTAVCHELATSDKFHALIILEGYDELPDNQRNSSSSIFNRLISGELPLITILVTSRSWATREICKNYEGHIYQHIEVLGFTKRQIAEYIEKTVPKDQMSDLNSYLERHPQIKCSMYIPLNSAIVVAVYKEGIEDDGSYLPNTVTEMCSCCIRILISRHLSCNKSVKEGSRTVLPAINISVPFEVQRHFVCMCELAYNGIVGSDKEVRLIFSDSELPTDFDNLGFMDSVTKHYVTGDTVSSHNFLQLAFQEFLAAVHISTMSPDEQVKYFTMSSGSKKEELKVVLKFLAGLCKLDCFTQESVSQIVTVPSKTVSSKYLTPCDIAVGTDVVNWLFEAQSENAISLILGKSKVEFKASKSQMYPMDYYSLGYCISHSQCQWVLSLTGKMALSKEVIKILAAGAANATGVGTIVGLGEDILLPSTDIDLLFTKWKSFLHMSLLSDLSLSNPGQQPMPALASSVAAAFNSGSVVKRSAVSSESGVLPSKRPKQRAPELPYIQSSSTLVRVAETEVDTFIEYVKKWYSCNIVVKDWKWSLSPTVKYINLACIDRRCIKSREYEDVTKAMVQDGNVDAIQEKKGPIEFGEIAKGIFLPSKPGPGSQPVDDRRLILVEGAPGVGKSTFAWEFCRRWMEGEVAHQYDLVLLLRLRDEGIRSATSLQDLISHPLPDVSTAVCHELATSDKFHALIILEGYDELPDNQRNSSSSIFNRLISGELLPFATILVTSRPWATGDIRRNYEGHIYQHIEVLGFTKRQITEYIKKTVPADQVNDLNSYLERHPQIKCGMYIPLSTAIVVAVYKEGIKNDEDKLPNTVTNLYICCIKLLISRRLNCLRISKEESRTVLPAINISVPLEVQRNFVCMCELAYNGIVGSDEEVRLIFSDSELPTDFDNLGFMDSVTKHYVTGDTVLSHNFLQLTFQEFLAAVHISTMSPDEQVKYFTMSSGSMKGRLKVVLQFLAGLCKLDCFTQESVSHIVTVPSKTVSSKYLTPCDIAVGTDVVNWLFEAQSENAISLILGKSKVKFKASKREMYPMDYYSLGYCISHSQCQWVLSLTGKMALSREKIKVLAAGAANATGVGTIVGLGEDVLLPSTNVEMLFTEWRSILRLNELPPRAESLLPILDLSDLKVLEINGEFPSLVSLPLSLCSLSINSHSLTYRDYVTIANLLSSTTCLKEFVYKKNILRWTLLKENVDLITKALATNQLLPLENLDLHFNERCVSDIKFLTIFVRNSTTLQRLSIMSLTASAEKLLEFLNTIYHHPTLQEKSLNLSKLACEVADDADVNALSQLYSSSYQVSMSNEFIKYIGGLSDDGTIVLAEILQHKYALQTLDLSHGGTSNDGVMSLANALHHNSTIRILILNDNSISDDEAVALAQTLRHNSTLHRLELQNNSIGDEGTSALAQSLHHNFSLKGLDLSRNNISDEGASVLAQSFHHNSTLRDLYLSENSIGDEGATALAQSLHHNSTLRDLYLSGNSIGDEGANALAQSLHHNSTLLCLRLLRNRIGDKGASALAQFFGRTFL